MSLESIVVRRMTEADIGEAVELIARPQSFNEELGPNFKVGDNLDEGVRG